MLRGKPTGQVGTIGLLDPAMGHCFAADLGCEVNYPLDPREEIYGGVLLLVQR